MHEFLPKSIVCFREGYSREDLLHDLFAGITIGVIALPLSLAFAIASGLLPEQGLFTAIVAGFLISLLGGSRVQIGGPTGAFVVVVYAVVQKRGYEGLALATLIAAVLMILLGLARSGVLLKFIPYPVTTGFTTGIAVVIALSQIGDFFGLRLEQTPAGFVEKCSLYCHLMHTWNLPATLIASGTLLLIFAFRYYWPKCPGTLIAIAVAALCVHVWQLPVETIDSKFGGIPSKLPMPSLPNFSYDLFKAVFPDAITIGLLGAIESLLSAVVADGMTGHRHRSNVELVAQGLANVGSVLFSGIPATGAIARTSANIKMGARTPMAGMFHALTLLLLMIFATPLAGKIPLASLAGVLLFVVWNMSELPHFIEILRERGGDALVLSITFLLTVFIDLAVAVQVGVILAAIVFLKRMTDRTTVESCRRVIREEAKEDSAKTEETQELLRQDISPDIALFQINGPFFYSVAGLLDEALLRLHPQPRLFILSLAFTSLIDATGVQAIKKFGIKCQKKGIAFLIVDAADERRNFLKASGIEKAIGAHHIFPNLDAALHAQHRP